MSTIVKKLIAKSINDALLMFKTSHKDQVFDVRYVVREGNDVNKIEVLFMAHMAANMGLPIMYSAEFKENYKEHWVESGKYASLNEETTPDVLVFNSQEDMLDCIVHNPNGSQAWPDIMVIKDNVGYPLEIKTAKETIPKMNSGIFRLNTPYICMRKSDDPKDRVMRMFMGSDMVTAENIIQWREAGEMVDRIVKATNAPNERWCYDKYFKAEDWFPKNWAEQHEVSVAKYINS